MAEPWEHPKTGVYYYRRVVPAHLRKALGKTEYRISLRTKLLGEAKARYPEKAAFVEAEFTRAAGGPARLTRQQSVALAGLWYSRELARLEADPGDAAGWDVWLSDFGDAFGVDGFLSEMKPGERKRLEKAKKALLDDRVRAPIAELLHEQRLVIDADSQAQLEDDVFASAIRLGTGARLEEVCQALVADVRKEGNIT